MIDTLALVLTGLGLAASIVYYANILNNANKAKERELINQRITMINDEFYTKWSRLLLGDWRTYPEWVVHRYETPEDSPLLSYFCTLFNSVGLLYKRGMIDSELLFSVYAPHVIMFTWEKVSPVVMGNRQLFNYPGLYAGFEFLNDEARKQYPDINSIGEYLRARQEIYDKHTIN